jgi:tetratricopeptide (TPR) repeat protein
MEYRAMLSRFPRFILALLVTLAALPAPAAAQDPIARGVRLFQQRQYPAARRALEPYVQSHPRDARAAHYLARVHLEERNPDAAIELLERAVSLDGRQSTYHLYLGNAYGVKAMSANPIRQALLARKAKGAFERAVELAPGNVDARWGLMRFHMRAPGLLGGDWNEALAQAAAIKRAAPYRGAEAFAVLHRHRNNLPAVAAEYEAAKRRFPDSVALYFRLGSTYDAMGRFDASAALFEELVRRRPEVMGSYYQIGRLGAITGRRLPRAEAMLQRYLRHTPRGAEPPLSYAHWRLGMVYERQGNRPRARAAYRAALALDPRNPEAKAALAKLGA